MNKQQFLKEFINEFFEKGKTKRRTDKTRAIYITKVINQVFFKHFGSTSKFNQTEIIQAFSELSFLILETNKNERSGITTNGGIEFNKCYISINTSILTKFVCANRKSNTDESNSFKLDFLNLRLE